MPKIKNHAYKIMKSTFVLIFLFFKRFKRGKSKYFLDNGANDKFELYFNLNDANSNEILLKT